MDLYLAIYGVCIDMRGHTHVYIHTYIHFQALDRQSAATLGRHDHSQ
jgi:hypothetical protein